MANRIHGPLYYERMGRSGPVIAFVHPNPMDQSCWIYQMAHLSSWYRCVAIDIPGYGRSPKADKGLTMDNMAQGCWEAIDDASGEGEAAILVGCSVGSAIIPYMYHQRPASTSALILSGTGYNPGKPFAKGRIEQYAAKGVDYRWEYAFQDMSASFRTTPMAPVRRVPLVAVQRECVCGQSARLVSVHQEALDQLALPHRRVSEQDDLDAVFGRLL